MNRPTLLLLAAATLWGAIGPAAGFAFAAGVRPLELACWRAAFAAPLFALLWVRGGSARPAPRDLLGMAAFGTVGIAGMYAAFFAAVEAGGDPLAAALLYTGPAWVAAIQRVTQGRRLGGAGRVALVLSVAGVAILTGAGTGAPPSAVAVLAGLASGAAFATHFTLAVPYLSRFGAPAVFAVAMTVAAIVLAPALRAPLPPAGAVPAIAFITLGATVMASVCFGRAVTRMPPVRAAVLSTWEPVVAALLAWAVWSTPIGAAQGMGALLILGAAVLVGRRGAADPPG